VLFLPLFVIVCACACVRACACVWPQISRPDSLYVDNILQVSIIAFSSYQTMIHTHVKQVFWNFEIMLLTKSCFKLQQGCPCFKKHKYTMLFPLRMSLNTATNCSSLIVVVGKGTRFHSNNSNKITWLAYIFYLFHKYFYFYWIFKCKNVCILQYLLCNI